MCLKYIPCADVLHMYFKYTCASIYLWYLISTLSTFECINVLYSLALCACSTKCTSSALLIYFKYIIELLIYFKHIQSTKVHRETVVVRGGVSEVLYPSTVSLVRTAVYSTLLVRANILHLNGKSE